VHDKKIQLVVLALVLAALVAVKFVAPAIIERGPAHEYKFVRLIDSGAMPVITDALNHEAEEGWSLTTMSAVAGQPGTIYLVFER